MYQPPKPKALHFWEFCNRIQLGRGLHSACCELDYKMCSLRRLVCWGEIWELFWVWSWSQLKKWKPTLEKIFIGEDEISPNELYNHPFCLGSLSEGLHCSYCWRWWFLGKKFTTDLKLGEFRKEWNEFGEHIKSACCFMVLAGQKKSKTNGFSKSCSVFFPTCQVRVVRFYVSLFSFSSSSFSFSFSSSSSSSSDLNCDPVSSVWRPGPQPRSCEFSVACRTPTAILRVQCGVPDPNRDPASSVWRPGPQPRSCEFSVACRTSTAILWVQCGGPDPNRDPVSSVWRAGPQPRSCEFSVAARTPTAILWVQCGVPDLKYCVRKFVRKICQKICQKECQKICQKDVRKNVRRYVRKNVKRYVRKNVKRYVRKNVRR